MTFLLVEVCHPSFSPLPPFPVDTDRVLYRYDALTGRYDGASTTIAPTPYNGAFDGRDLCVSQNSNDIYCYQLLSSNIWDGVSLSPVLHSVSRCFIEAVFSLLLSLVPVSSSRWLRAGRPISHLPVHLFVFNPRS